MAIHAAPAAIPAIAMANSTTTGGIVLATANPAAIAATPPTTNAPSPPMIINPVCAGSAVQSAVRMSGAARVIVFWIENHDPTEPTTM